MLWRRETAVANSYVESLCQAHAHHFRAYVSLEILVQQIESLMKTSQAVLISYIYVECI